MVHARGYFEKAVDNDKFRSEYVLKQTQRLYAMELNVKERGVNFKILKRYRQIYALPVLNGIETKLSSISSTCGYCNIPQK